jgi:uncharacterized protein (DUF58 family)
LPRTEAGPLERSLEHLARIARTGHRIYLVSDFEHLSTHGEQLLRRIARHNGVVAIAIGDALEHALPPADSYLVTDGIQRQRIDAANQAARRDYAERYAARRHALAALCRGAQIQLIELETHEDAVDRLKRRLS